MAVDGGCGCWWLLVGRWLLVGGTQVHEKIKGFTSKNFNDMYNKILINIFKNIYIYLCNSRKNDTRNYGRGM